jgi:hypothetical protein
MINEKDLNERGNRDGQFTQGVGGWAEYTVHMTEIEDTVRHDLELPPGKLIPIIFLPGVMGSNLRVSKVRQEELHLSNNCAWRPDNLVSTAGKTEIVTDKGPAAWFTNATPAQRQLNFDPNATEVEYYHYTENNKIFDPEGKKTLEFDARHSNVPHNLSAIPPLLGAYPQSPPYLLRTKRKYASPAQLARWRGWSEVLFSGAYGTMLQTTELLLNNMVKANKIHPLWRNEWPSGVPHRDLITLLLQRPTQFGASAGEALTEAEIRKVSPCWYPVHAMGYNFLKSNGESAVAIAERIRGLVQGYKERNFKCEEVIIVTHSMGGLLGRALLHPKYGNLLADKSVKVLGMYHSVMPTTGAAATYKRMRFGFQEGTSKIAEMEARVIGVDGKHATAILANTPGPLELLPSNAYGSEWLKIVSVIGEPIASWPSVSQNSLDSIYLQPDNIWWRLVNPLWVNPGNVKQNVGGGIEKCYTRIRKALIFSNSIQDTFHPTNCWISFCESEKQLSYGDVVFSITNSDVSGPVLKQIPPPQFWKIIADDAKGKLIVQAGDRKLTLQLQRPQARGDQTVPSVRSAQKAKGFRFVHGKASDPGYDHQGSYSDHKVLAAMMYSIIKIATSANWK